MAKVKDGKIKIKDVIPNNGTKKYLSVKGGSASVNLDKVSSDTQWDGLYGIISNAKEDDIAKLIERYRGLWQIEESFRVNKHDLKMRPIFHWKPERVRAHIAICFLAYAMAKQAVYRLRNQAGLKISFEQ